MNQTFDHKTTRNNMKNLLLKRVLNTAILLTLVGAITQNASAQILLPDAGSTSLLMAIACAGLVAARRFKR
jgi:hypothetical protein